MINNINNLTLITRSYNTPVLIETMLKSFKFYNDYAKEMRLIIYENSENDDTRDLLDSNNIPYIKNIGGFHSPSIDSALKQCKTKYALVIDSDIIFKKSIYDIFNYVVSNEIVLGGYKTFYRAGYNLKPRINPWFMFIDVETVNKNNISFHNEIKIQESNSSAFYTHVPIETNTIDLLYDVGSTFYEDIMNAKLKIDCIPTVTTYFKHYEGSSWRDKSNIQQLKQLYDTQMIEYETEVSNMRDIHINDFYVGGF